MQIGSKIVELALWDTAGQEDYDRLRPLSYPDAHVILLCYSVDCPDSFHNLREKWIPEIRHFCAHVPIILVGNKSDLRADESVSDKLKGTFVSMEEGRLLCAQIGAHAFIECSAKNRYNVETLFAKAASVALTNRQCRQPRKHKLCTVV